MTAGHPRLRAALVAALLGLLAAALPAAAQTDPWSPYRYFAGSWKGEGTGRLGKSEVTRVTEWYGPSLLRFESAARYAPPEAGRQGELYRETAYLSIDHQGGRFILRLFGTAGVFSQYAAVGGGENEYIFESEAVEGLEAGSRTRVTWRIAGSDEYGEVYEVAEPGGDYKVQVTNTLRRMPAASKGD